RIAPPPPAAPLLPYTTLFRSLGYSSAASVSPGPPHPVAARPPFRGRGGRGVSAPLAIWVVSDGRTGIQNQALGLAEAVARLTPADRKSTRLNSSHVKISYAVF